VFIVKKKGEVARFGVFLILMGLLAYFVMNHFELFRSTAAPAPAPVTPTARTAASKPAQTPVTAASDGQDFFAETRLEREQDRSLRQEQLTRMINNPNIADEVRKSASEELQTALKYASLENQTEALIRGRGVQDVIVTLTENAAVVYVKAKSHDVKDALQVADMVSTVTGLKSAAVKVRFQD
jgi:stage III sporulation protein AH